MPIYFDIGECFRHLQHADRPADLWKIVDDLLIKHPYSNKGLSLKEITMNANPVVLYGAGKFAESVINCWQKDGIKPNYCVDSDSRKWGTSIKDIPVLEPQVLFQEENSPLIVIAAMATHEVEKELDARGISYLYAERDGSIGHLSGHWLNRHRVDFERVYVALADDESRRVLMEVAKARMFQWCHFSMRGNFFSADIASYPQYFCEEILSFSDGEVFVDCGAFDGDTLIAFAALMERLRKQSWSAIAFEVDRENFSQIETNLKRYGIDCVKVINAGVGKENAIAPSTSYFNCRQNSAAYEVQTVSLDKALLGITPTFIKMDIEGYELDALAGAKETIFKHHPKLAICSYHTTSQLLEVPLFILDNFPDYRLHMRHHSAGTLWETVCYACVG